MAKIMADIRQALFDSKGFLAFTLDSPDGPDELRRATLTDGTVATLWNEGVLSFEPAQHRYQGKSVLISCGVHGNETAPMEICDALVEQICRGQIEVRNRLLFILGNPAAARIQERFCDENLNRLFSGKHTEPALAELPEGQRAALIESHTAQFFAGANDHRLHYDLHTAIRGSLHEKFAVYPFLHERPWSAAQLAFLEQCGIEAVLLSHQPSTTYSYFSSHAFGADAFTVELGKVRPFGENDLRRFTPLVSALTGLIEGCEQYTGQPQTVLAYEVIAEVIKRTDRFTFSFADDVENFTPFKQGDVLVNDGDAQYVVQRDGERIIFPHPHVPVGHRALLVVYPKPLSQLQPGGNA